MKKKILVTGGTGRFGTVLKKLKTNYEILFPSKKILDVTKYKSIQKYIKFKKPNFVIHLAGLSRPMNIFLRIMFIQALGVTMWNLIACYP